MSEETVYVRVDPSRKLPWVVAPDRVEGEAWLQKHLGRVPTGREVLHVVRQASQLRGYRAPGMRIVVVDPTRCEPSLLSTVDYYRVLGASVEVVLS